jgi:hypothetical protein
MERTAERTEAPMNRTQHLVDQYVAMWNEPAAEARHRLVRAVFNPHAVHRVEGPEEVRDIARALGFPAVTLEVRGHDELDFRVDQAYGEFVAPGTYRFRARGDAARLGRIVKFGWEMVAGDGVVAATGTDVVELDDDGRIVADDQFVD